MSKPRVLFSIPTRHHVEIALDELEGLQELGYPCGQFSYSAKEGVTSTAGRLKVILSNAWALVKVAKQFKPDVIYFNSRLEVIAGMRDYITIRMFRLFYRRPVCILLKSHGSDIDVLQSKQRLVSKTILPYLQKNITGWLFLSSEERRLIVNSGFLPEQRVFVTKNIVRSNHFKHDSLFKSKLKIPADCKVLLFVGRLIKEKGIYEVIEGFARLNDQLTKTVLIVVGWGTEEIELKQLCERLNIADHVIFTGFIPEQDVVAYYANSDVLVFPTYFPEGFPMALFNSVAAGLGIVTTPTRAAADYLTSPDNCLWAEGQNSESVYQALKMLLSDEQLLRDMKQQNVKKGQEFSKAQVAAELSAIIEQAIKL
ncbi:glycosyltransferase family 4 protein [Mucilaginibacter sp. CSA2-8R]|uniref:glycosyltransferase family 4 protein n=1 Tax=Mucilaginibacter sp. CSA2-8R TaxID=3141542 RepID=UPI00315DD628